MFSPVIKESSTPNDAACLELLLGLLTPDLKCKSLKMQGKWLCSCTTPKNT